MKYKINSLDAKCFYIKLRDIDALLSIGIMRRLRPWTGQGCIFLQMRTGFGLESYTNDLGFVEGYWCITECVAKTSQRRYTYRTLCRNIVKTGMWKNKFILPYALPHSRYILPQFRTTLRKHYVKWNVEEFIHSSTFHSFFPHIRQESRTMMRKPFEK